MNFYRPYVVWLSLCINMLNYSSERGHSPEMGECTAPVAVPISTNAAVTPIVARRVAFAPDVKESTSGKPEKKAMPHPIFTTEVPVVRVGYPALVQASTSAERKQSQPIVTASVGLQSLQEKIDLFRRMRNRFAIITNIIDETGRAISVSQMNRKQLLRRKGELEQVVQIEEEYASKAHYEGIGEAQRLLQEVQYYLHQLGRH